jgi:hypothetical protein
MYDDGDPWAVLDSQLRSTVASNYRGYASVEWVAAVTELKEAETGDETLAVLADLQEIWNETISSMNYRAVKNVAPTAERVHGITSTHEGVLLFGEAFVD